MWCFVVLVLLLRFFGFWMVDGLIYVSFHSHSQFMTFLKVRMEWAGGAKFGASLRQTTRTPPDFGFLGPVELLSAV